MFAIRLAYYFQNLNVILTNSTLKALGQNYGAMHKEISTFLKGFAPEIQ
jgi:hypothetical protein